MRKFFEAINEKYPILKYLYIARPIEDISTILRFPETIQAPYLRKTLQGFALPKGFQLLTTVVGPVTLQLVMSIYPRTSIRILCLNGVSYYLEALVHRITTPRLKELNIYFFN